MYIVAYSISAMNKPGIEEAVVLLMQHTLQVNPAQPSWLRTQADIYFGANIIYILFLKMTYSSLGSVYMIVSKALKILFLACLVSVLFHLYMYLLVIWIVKICLRLRNIKICLHLRKVNFCLRLET